MKNLELREEKPPSQGHGAVEWAQTQNQASLALKPKPFLPVPPKEIGKEGISAKGAKEIGQ